MLNCTLPATSPSPSGPLSCYQIDPIRDPRWTAFVSSHIRASVFHTVPWLRALQRTYGYQPVVLTTSPEKGELKNGLVLCKVDSWLTGRRLVSLPFSDHCELLCDSIEDVACVIGCAQGLLEKERGKYMQLRPASEGLGKLDGAKACFPDAKYFLHTLDLRPDLDELLRGFDKDSVQRRISRADRAGLVEKCGTSSEFLRDFYALFILTRRRQKTPPTPYVWFQNLVQELGAKLEIRVAYKEETPIAAIMTLRFRDRSYYKYGCSDARFNNYGATPWLFWKAITAAKLSGATQFDLGRTELTNGGLLAFKNQWVPKPQTIVYWRYPARPKRSQAGWKQNAARNVFSVLPGILQARIGSFLYPHIG